MAQTPQPEISVTDAAESRLLREERTIRSKFIHTLAHDLRNPLAALKLTAQMLALGGAVELDPVRMGERLNRIADHLDDVIQNLLDAGRIQAGKALHIERSPSDLRDIVAVTVEGLRESHGDYFFFDPGPARVGNFDVRSLRRALHQLMDNGLRYGQSGAGVTVRLERNDDADLILVSNVPKDANPGALESWIQAFHRPTDENSERGWGLGLALARAVAEAHGGSLELREAPGATTMIMRLPREV